MNETIENILGKCKASFHKQPDSIPSYMGVDAPILGNGDMICAFAGWEKSLEFYITANDFWRLENSGKLGHSGPRPAARLVLDIPALHEAKIKVHQDLYRAVTIMQAKKNNSTIEAVFRISSDENMLMAEISAQGEDIDIAARFESFPVNMVAPYDTFLATRKIPVNIELMIPFQWTERISSIRLCDDEKLIREFTPAEGVKASPERIAMPWNDVLKGAALLYTDRVNFKKVNLSCNVDGTKCTGDGIVLSTAFWAVCAGYTNGFFVRDGKWSLRWYDQWIESNIPANGKTQLKAIVDNKKMAFFVGGRLAGECKFNYYPDEERGRDENKIFNIRSYSKGVALHTEAACAARFIGSKSADAITVKAGTTERFVLALRSRFKNSTPLKAANWRIMMSDKEDFNCMTASHETWWRRFWAVSKVEFRDLELMKSYYMSQYILGSISRDPEFPPHIFGMMTSDYPEWNGDYHLNYNHQVPFLAMYSSGRFAQADPYTAPVLEYMDRGMFHSLIELGLRGVYYPCGIGPKGTDTASMLDDPGLFHGQRSNAAFCCVNLAMRWYSTYEPEYGMKIYPMVRRTIEFWEGYLKLEDGRYVILNDSVQENSGEDKNGILSIGLVRMVLLLGIDIAREIGIKDDKIDKWERILDMFSPYPVKTVAQVHEKVWQHKGVHINTTLKDTDKVFALSEAGHWNIGCTLVTQHIYPAGGVGPGDDVRLMEIARNTVQLKTEFDGMTGAWRDFNHMSMFYPSAVRVGYDCTVIWKNLKAAVADLFWENGFDAHAPFAENLSLVPNTINEMMLQSYNGVIRVFYAWPAEFEPEASFEGLIAYGAFEVSASMSGGKVRNISILSIRGRQCRILNPWKTAEISSDMGMAIRTEEAVFSMKTVVGQRIFIKPCNEVVE